MEDKGQELDTIALINALVGVIRINAFDLTSPLIMSATDKLTELIKSIEV